MNLRATFFIRLPGKRLTYDCHLKGNVWGIFGPSGAGKTTFFHALAGLRKPDGGSLEFNGVQLFRENQAHVPPHKRRIGYVFQDYRLFPHLSVLGNLRFGETLGKKSGVQITINELVSLFGLKHCLTRMIPDISGGEMQRVAIARAILCGPELLLLDEPFKGLDDRRKRHLQLVFNELARKQKLNILLISHQLDDLFSLTENLMLMNDGNIVAYGPYTELIKDEQARALLNRTGKPTLCPY